MTAWDGLPPNPERDGWHWLGAGPAYASPAHWDATRQIWTQGGLCCGGSMTPEHAASKHYEPMVQWLAVCPLPEGQS